MFSNVQILLRIISESWPLELMTVVTSDYTNCKLTVQCQFINANGSVHIFRSRPLEASVTLLRENPLAV